MTHELKILKSFADAVYSGDKTFEIRENDRGFQKGDKVIFKAVENRAAGTYEVVMFEDATIAHLIPIDAYGEEDEDAEEDY